MKIRPLTVLTDPVMATLAFKSLTALKTWPS